MSACPRWCCWTPFACAHNYTCDHHQPSLETRAGQLTADFYAARRPQVPDHTQRSILAAQIGVDGAVEVARRFKVSPSAVHDIWRQARSDE